MGKGTIIKDGADAIIDLILKPAAKVAKKSRFAPKMAAKMTVAPKTYAKSAPADISAYLDTVSPAGIGHNGGPRLSSPLDTVDLPAGNKPRYRGAAPNRAAMSFPRYSPKKVPARMERLIASADDPNHAINRMFDSYIEKGKTLNGSDWYNSEELRDWYRAELGPDAGDAAWREYVDQIGATSTGSAVPDNIRNASFYNVLSDEDKRAVAQLVKMGDGRDAKGKRISITPAEAARKLGIVVPNAPPAKGPGSYNYGHLMQANHGGNILNQLDGEWARMPPPELKGAALTEWLQANPKVKGFANDLLGDDQNIAADKHFMRMLAMSDGGTDFLSEAAPGTVEMLDTLRTAYGPRIDDFIVVRDVKGKPVTQVNLANAVKAGVIDDTAPLKSLPGAWLDTPKDTEYGALESMAQRLAKRYGMTPAQFQANLWMGAGDMTNLADESQGTFMDLFRRSLDKRAGDRGITRREMLTDFIHKRSPLAVGPLGLMAMPGREEN